MSGVVISFIVGVVCIILGISNMRGNISSLHSYHTHRISEEDILPFGRLVGIGIIIVGVVIAIFSVLTAIGLYTQKNSLVIIGNVILFLGLAVGIGISLYAIIKYNKGLF